MSPILPFVVQSLIQNLHNLDEVIPRWGWDGLTRTEAKWNRCEDELVVCHLGNLVHLGARGAPGVVGGGIANLCLDVRVTLCVVFGDAESTLAKVLYGHDEDGGAGEKPVAFLFGPKVSPCAVDRATRRWSMLFRSLQDVCYAPRDREESPRCTTCSVCRLEVVNSHLHLSTLVVKRLSSLPSKQGAGVRLPPSVAFSHPRSRRTFRTSPNCQNVHPILLYLIRGILIWSL